MSLERRIEDWIKKAEKNNLFLTIDQLAAYPLYQDLVVIGVDYIQFEATENRLHVPPTSSVEEVFSHYPTFLTRESEMLEKPRSICKCRSDRPTTVMTPYLTISFQDPYDSELETFDIYPEIDSRVLAVGSGDGFTRFVPWDRIFSV